MFKMQPVKDPKSFILNILGPSLMFLIKQATSLSPRWQSSRLDGLMYNHILFGPHSVLH